ncbi:claudin-18 [Danio aesculapii]|uniref:claudin-18 n=1 Tax=Danio aesculapii TaxID=1142201 RepID=UPI0024BF21F8|nr:claudin-18 [Danio aesculapii]
MSAPALQTTGFVSGVIGTAGVFAATLMDVWCFRNQQQDHPQKISPIYTYKGLWKDCEMSGTVFPECQPLYSHPNYSGILQAARALMIIAILVAVIAVFIGFFCLKCLKMRNMQLSTRAKLILSSAIIFFIAGICGIAAASVYADQLVPSFMMPQFNQKQGEKGGVQCANNVAAMDPSASRYTFGPALYIAWVGAALLILGGILMSIAYKRMQCKTETREGYIYNAAQCRAAEEESQCQTQCQSLSQCQYQCHSQVQRI